MKLANRMSRFSGSPTSALITKVAELRKEGRDIISLNVGEPDYQTPDNIKTAGIKAIVDGFTKYTPVPGIVELRQEISKKLLEDNGLEYNLNEICVTVGAKQAIFNAIMATCDEGDEIIIPIPCWVSYVDMVKIANAKPILVPVQEENGYVLDIEAIKAAVTPNTRAIIICTPNNPTGAVYSKKSLEQLVDIACENDFWVITDEIYEKLIYDDNKHISCASISKKAWEHTITVNGFSKAYSMTGWRVGYAAGPKQVIDAMKSLQSQMTSATSGISQKAATVALSGSQHDIEVMVEAFKERRKYVVNRLNSIKGLSCSTPAGAFYIMVDVSYYLGKKYNEYEIKTTIDLATYILDTVNVAVVPGEAFFTSGKIRISYSNSMENLGKALSRVEEALSKLDN